MYSDKFEIKILVKNRPIVEYRHRGQTFIEGREGSEYEIEVTNKTSGRVEAVISVDGLSIMDGKLAGTQSSGYLLHGNETIKIPGWKLNDKAAAKFAFSGKKESYSTQMSGDSRNNGVIGVMVFDEKNPYGQWINSTYNPTGLLYGYNPTGYLYGYPQNSIATNQNSWTGIAASAASLPTNFVNASTQHSQMSASTNRSRHSNKMSKSSSSFVSDEEYTSGGVLSNYLGTAFGQSTDFNTTKVEFQRGDLLSILQIYYDNARGLKSRGIDVTRKKYIKSQPEAFPAMSGCVPPPGWRG